MTAHDRKTKMRKQDEELRVLLVRTKSTVNTERYDEVLANGNPVMRSTYLERAALRALVTADGSLPDVIEMTVRAVDPKTLQ